MKSSCKTGLFLMLAGAFLLNSSHGRTIEKRSPQLMLTVIDEPEDEAKREHPPSPEDLEERRKKLIKALVPGDGSGGAIGSQLQSLTDLGVDLLSGGRTSELFAPLFNATRKATANFPRVGDVINRVIDGAREYRQTARGALRESASSKINNAVRVGSTFAARGTEVLGGVFTLLRTLLDNFTYAVQNLATRLSTGLVKFAQAKTLFLSRNFARARNLLNNQRLFQPAKDAAALGGNLIRGLAQDFTSLQPTVSEGVKTKINVGTRLIPRVRLSSILAPLGEKEPCNDDEGVGGDTEDVGDGGYGKKRGSDEDAEKEEKAPMSAEDIPKDILDLLESSKSEKKASPDGVSGEGVTATTSKSTDSNEISKGTRKKVSTRSTTTIKSTTPSTTTEPTKKPTKDSAKVATSKKSSSSSAERTADVENLFGV